MTRSAVCSDILEALDVLSNFSLEVSFKLHVLDDLADRRFLIGRKVLDLRKRINLRLGCDSKRASWSDSVDRRKTVLDVLLIWECNS